MNFRTTLILLVLLLGVGILALVSRNVDTTAPVETPPQRLLSLTAADVSKVSIAPDEGQKIVLEKADGKWRLSEPVKGPAEDLTASALVDTISNLTSRGKVAADASTGLDKPRYKLEVVAKDKTIKLDVGSRSGAGDNLYVRVDGQSRADVVPAALYTNLDKPLHQWRQEKLFEASTANIKQLRIATTQQTITLEKEADTWKMAGPTSMPVDPTAASDLTLALANLRAVDFVSETSSDLRKYGLEPPAMTVSFSLQPPATQPSTTQPAMTTLTFGRYDDVLKRNVYASTSTSPGVVTVVATAMDSFRKKPIDIRDKKLLAINPDKVNKITITTDKPATTQPTTREASKETVVLEHAKAVMGPMLPTTGPATTQAAATQPTDPPSKWVIASKDGAEADDPKIEQLMTELNPLRVTRYIDTAPAGKVEGTYTLTIDATDAQIQIVFTDPGGSLPLVGMYNGLMFEVSRFVMDRVSGDFTKQPKMPDLPMGLPPGMPPGIPFQ